MVFAAPALFIGLLLGIWLKRWRVVLVLVIVGLIVFAVGWQAAWFADEDTPALGGALLIELFIFAPIALGAAVGVYLMRSRAGTRGVEGSSLPIVGPGSGFPHR
jgi:hypothetical protein